MRGDIVPGAVFPDYELTDHTGKRRKLSELQGQHPMVLVLSRGGFCPKDRRQAEGLLQLHRELEVGYCRLVTISTDSIAQTNEYRSGAGAHWPFLSDAGRHVQKDLDIAEYTDPINNPMIPHVIVLESGLVVYKIYNGYWFFGRPTMEELRQDLSVVTRKCRPDWDITTPDLRAAWQEGRRELFYPYGKTYRAPARRRRRSLCINYERSLRCTDCESVHASMEPGGTPNRHSPGGPAIVSNPKVGPRPLA
jgi:peroxiredoxin